MNAGRGIGRALTALLATALAFGGRRCRAAEPAAATSGSEAVSRAVDGVRRDIETAKAELEALRRAIDDERLPLSRRLLALEAGVTAMRAEADRTGGARLRAGEDREALAADVAAREEECRFVHTLLSEYRRSMETRAGAAESALLADRLAAVDAAMSDEGGFRRLPEAARELLALAGEWGERKLGGMTFAGSALDAQGMEHEGRFAVFGPASYFAASDGGLAGVTVLRPGSPRPSVYTDFADAQRRAVAEVASGREAMVPVDVTGGDVFKLAAARSSLVGHILKGGVVMVPILLVGLVAAVMAAWKLADVSRLRVESGEGAVRVLDALRRGDADGAKGIAASLGEPMAPVYLEGIEHRGASEERLEEMLTERILACVPRLERNLGALAVLGGVAPLLGLLGTVTGMIHTFQLITVFGSGDPKLLSGGIAEALITTEYGLYIAIPVVLAHAYLARRVRTIVGAMERRAAEFVHGLKVGGSGR